MVWFSFWVCCYTFIFDISNITIVVVSGVCYSLDATIREMYGIRAAYNLTIGIFWCSKVSPRVIILSGIFVSVWFGGFIIMWSLAICWSRGVI